MKLLLVLLITTSSVTAQISSEQSIKSTGSSQTCLPGTLFQLHNGAIVFTSESILIENQSLKQINDSLKQKLSLALEYQAYTCPIVANLYLKNRAGARLLKVKDMEQLKRSIMRYNNRYKINAPGEVSPGAGKPNY